MSGGRATVAQKRGEKLSRQAGDISAVAPEAHVLTTPYYVELKHYRSLDLEAFFLNGKGRLAKFWRVAVTEARRHERSPILIVRQNRTPDLFITKPGAVGRSELRQSMLLKVNVPGLPPCEVRLFSEVLKNPFAGLLRA